MHEHLHHGTREHCVFKIFLVYNCSKEHIWAKKEFEVFGDEKNRPFVDLF
jgi:hypothetical protein